MWLPGHLAVAFLICTPLLLYSRRKGEDPILALVYVAFFAVFPDFLHIGDFRMVSHSLIGLAALVLIALVILFYVSEVRKSLVAIASIAVGAHLFADWMYGHFFPLFPFSIEYVSLNTFNTYVDVMAEIALFAVATVVFAALVISGRHDCRSVKTARGAKLGYLVLLLPFLAMTVLETVYFVQNMLIIGTGVTRLILLAIFGVLLGATLLVIREVLEL
ncbi:MAG: metal-dependent hydrolase [Methanomassiliicoccales archaeon]|nr:metal-dependent hydrolase [Methanomassiliicoccales archaeon]